MPSGGLKNTWVLSRYLHTYVPRAKINICPSKNNPEGLFCFSRDIWTHWELQLFRLQGAYMHTEHTSAASDFSGVKRPSLLLATADHRGRGRLSQLLRILSSLSLVYVHHSPVIILPAFNQRGVCSLTRLRCGLASFPHKRRLSLPSSAVVTSGTRAEPAFPSSCLLEPSSSLSSNNKTYHSLSLSVSSSSAVQTLHPSRSVVLPQLAFYLLHLQVGFHQTSVYPAVVCACEHDSLSFRPIATLHMYSTSYVHNQSSSVWPAVQWSAYPQLHHDFRRARVVAGAIKNDPSLEPTQGFALCSLRGFARFCCSVSPGHGFTVRIGPVQRWAPSMYPSTPALTILKSYSKSKWPVISRRSSKPLNFCFLLPVA